MQFDRRIICPIWIPSMHDWKTLRPITSSKYSTAVLNIWVHWKSTPDLVYYHVHFRVFLKSPVVIITIEHPTSEISLVYPFNSSLAQYYTIYIQIYILLYNTLYNIIAAKWLAALSSHEVQPKKKARVPEHLGISSVCLLTWLSSLIDVSYTLYVLLYVLPYYYFYKSIWSFFLCVVDKLKHHHYVKLLSVYVFLRFKHFPTIVSNKGSTV